MADVQYTYTKSPVSVDRLGQEIRQSSIVTALDYITYSDPTLLVVFKAALSPTDQTTLDSLVAAHSGVPLPEAPAPTNVAGVPQVEVIPRQGTAASHGTSIATHDFSKKHTWYQKSVQYTADTLVDQGDGVTFKGTHPLWIYIDQTTGDGFWEKKGLPKLDGSMGYHTDYAVTVKVNGVVADPSTYTVDPAAGQVVFTTSQAGNAVTATYWSTDGVTLASEWILLAPAGTKYLVESAKILCSINPTMVMPLYFEVWGAGVANNYAAIAGYPESLVNTAYCGKRDVYRNLKDFAINCNDIEMIHDGAGGSVGGGFAKPALIFKWDYVQVFFIDSTKSIVFRSYVKGDVAITGTDLAVGAFYIQAMPTS